MTEQEAITAVDSMDDTEKSLIHVMGSITGLVLKGFITTTESCAALTPSGMMLFAEIENRGWKPTDEQRLFAVNAVRGME
jgi:hypothetical protein